MGLLDRDPEVRMIALNDGSRRQWRVERYAGRYLFIGPEPGTMLFHSCEATSWDLAAKEARKRWRDADKVRRDKWYGINGIYTKRKAA